MDDPVLVQKKVTPGNAEPYLTYKYILSPLPSSHLPNPKFPQTRKMAIPIPWYPWNKCQGSR